jgi:hypothetical protein
MAFPLSLVPSPSRYPRRIAPWHTQIAARNILDRPSRYLHALDCHAAHRQWPLVGAELIGRRRCDWTLALTPLDFEVLEEACVELGLLQRLDAVDAPVPEALPRPFYVGTEPLPTKGTIEVICEVTGDESGLIIDTFTVDGDGTAHYAMEETASTPSTKNRITAPDRRGEPRTLNDASGNRNASPGSPSLGARSGSALNLLNIEREPREHMAWTMRRGCATLGSV